MYREGIPARGVGGVGMSQSKLVALSRQAGGASSSEGWIHVDPAAVVAVYYDHATHGVVVSLSNGESLVAYEPIQVILQKLGRS